jgi:hypothetical protein
VAGQVQFEAGTAGVLTYGIGKTVFPKIRRPVAAVPAALPRRTGKEEKIMGFRRSMSLQTKFITGLAVFALSLGLFFGGTLFFHLRSVMLQEVSDKSNLILAQADAVQDYVRRDLRPAMFQVLPPDRFIISAMSSSYISRHIMERLNVQDTHYYYRRVALNARNPDSIPTSLERGLISQFRSNHALKRWEGNVTLRGEKYHLTARPVVYEESCMRCHGNPQDAPPNC